MPSKKSKSTRATREAARNNNLLSFVINGIGRASDLREEAYKKVAEADAKVAEANAKVAEANKKNAELKIKLALALACIQNATLKGTSSVTEDNSRLFTSRVKKNRSTQKKKDDSRLFASLVEKSRSAQTRKARVR